MADPNGTPVWFELTTQDQDKAQAFYQAVAGWTVSESPAPEHGGYRLAKASQGGSVAGIMKPPPGMDGLPGWVIYFATDDVDAAAARVQQLGGVIHFGPMDIPLVGRFATVADPQGVAFQIITSSSPEPSTAFRQVAPGGTEGLGHGVWIDLATPDPNGALDFYGKLFGWENKGAMPMGDHGDYIFIGTGDDVRLGGVMSSRTTGSPACWNWYVHVPDIDNAVEVTQAQGGTILQQPTPIPGGGYSAKIQDAQGHQIGLVGRRG